MKFYTNCHYTGSSILLRQYNEGKAEKVRINFSPSLFLVSSNKTNYKTIDGRYADELTFINIHELNNFKKTYENVDNFEIHGDIGGEYQYISREFGAECQYDFRSLGVMYIDIETTCERGFPSIENPEESIIAITCKIRGKKTVFCLGDFTWDEINVDVNCYDDEQQLLREFIEYMEITQPDIISGWNVRLFDIPYLVNRIKKILDEKMMKRLSPWGIIRDKIVNKGGRDYNVFDLVGISTLDYFELYKTFTYTNQESYKLDHIAYMELGERKISYNEYESLSDFYKKNFQKFVEYNMKDTELVERLEEKLKLMELAVALAYSAGVNFQDVFSQVRTWDVIIYNYLLKQGIVIPAKKDNIKDEEYVGAYVKEPIVGMHDWVVSYDVNSLYPSLIIHHNISPETVLEKNFKGKFKVEDILKKDSTSKTYECMDAAKEMNASITANGTMYSNEKQGFLPKLMDKMYSERKFFKDKMIESKKKLESVNAELVKRGLKS
jgi:DNA polymerase elongation subunit (family B)